MYNELNQDEAISHQEVVFRSRTDWKAVKPFICDFTCILRSEHDHTHTDNRGAQNAKMVEGNTINQNMICPPDIVPET